MSISNEIIPIIEYDINCLKNNLILLKTIIKNYIKSINIVYDNNNIKIIDKINSIGKNIQYSDTLSFLMYACDNNEDKINNFITIIDISKSEF